MTEATFALLRCTVVAHSQAGGGGTPVRELLGCQGGGRGEETGKGLGIGRREGGGWGGEGGDDGTSDVRTCLLNTKIVFTESSSFFLLPLPCT